MEQQPNKPSVDQRFDEMMSLMTRGFHNMDNNIRELRRDITGLREDVEGLKQEVGDLKQEVGDLRRDFTDFKKETARNFQDVNFKIDFVRDELLKIDLVIRYEEQYRNMRGLPR